MRQIYGTPLPLAVAGGVVANDTTGGLETIARGLRYRFTAP